MANKIAAGIPILLVALLAGGLAGCGGDDDSAPTETTEPDSSGTPEAPEDPGAPDDPEAPDTPSEPEAKPSATSLIIRRDVLIAADIWDPEPKIYSANLAAVGMVGVPGMSLDDLARSEQLSRMAGGNWNRVTGANPTLDSYTSSPTPEDIEGIAGYTIEYGDGLPIVFSWPMLPSTVNPEDFLFTLSDGSQVKPQMAALAPNYDYNERSTVVVFGKFGNRGAPGTPGAVYPVRLEIVDDGTPLQLVGPGPRFVSAVGMSVAAGTAYGDPDASPEDRAGPRLVAAKLTRMSNLGDIAPPLYGIASPNDGITLYGELAQYRLRVYTSGGFSPDGVRGMQPTEFSRHFRLHAGDHLLTETGVPYQIGDGTITVIGLAELGLPQAEYDDTYVEDQDNQIDIVLAGDEDAIRRITAVEVPALPPYFPVYNPGGPGNDPTSGVRYTSPSPPHIQPVWVALDEPTTVTYVAPNLALPEDVKEHLAKLKAASSAE
ncbi:MAG: hypothetical protein AB7E55_14270 [Pigmentiphaga sp.]